MAGCSPHLGRRALYADSFAEEPPKDADIGTLRKRLLPYLEFFEDRYFTEEQTGRDAPVKARSRVRSKPKRTFADPLAARVPAGHDPRTAAP